MPEAEVEVQTYVMPVTPITEPAPDHVWTEQERVEYLLDRSWSIEKILRRTRISRSRLHEMIDAIDEARVARMAIAPDVIRARHAAYLQEVAAVAFEAVERSGNVRSLRVGMEALNQIRAIYGLNAPTRSENLNVHATLVSPQHQQAMIDDAEYRERLLALEDREWTLLGESQGPGHVAGPVRLGGERGAVEPRAAPEAPEPPPDGHDDRPD